MAKWNTTARNMVMKKLKQAKETRSRFGLSMDGWKSKGVCKRTFYGLVCQWISADWTLESVCLGIPEKTDRKRAIELRNTAAEVMEDLEVSAADAISFTTDHEQAQRNAVQTLALAASRVMVLPRQVLPLVRVRRQVAAGDDESDSSSDNDSESTSDSEEGDASDSGDCRSGAARPEASPTIDPHQQERQVLRKSLEPLFQKARKIVGWMLRNPDPYIEFASVCKTNKWKWKRFATEKSNDILLAAGSAHVASAQQWVYGACEG